MGLGRPCLHDFSRIRWNAIIVNLIWKKNGIYWVLVFTASVYLILLFLSPVLALEGKMNNNSKEIVREVFGAGRWFPKDRVALKTMVNGYIDEAVVEKSQGLIISAIAPHAGYVYSGKVAGYTFRAIKENIQMGFHPETVVVLGISHRGGFPGVALMDGDSIKTPLGNVVLDKNAGQLLTTKSQRIFFDYHPHRGEHSAENLIPFVQTAMPGIKAVIGIIGDHDSKTIKDLVLSLCDLAKEKPIMVLASSDMLHDPDYTRVTRTDKQTLEIVKAMDCDKLGKEWKMSKQLFCGIGPVLVAMQFAEQQGCRKGSILYYRNSGDDFPESRGNWVVGYSSVIFVTPEQLYKK